VGGALIALLPADVRPADPSVEIAVIAPDGIRDDVDLARIGFFVPPYMGPLRNFELIADMPRVEVVQLLTAGFDSALPYVRPGISLCRATGVHDASTAELAVALILASLRGLDDFSRAMPDGRWMPTRRTSLADRRVLVIGAGGVGRAIARRLVPFETDVVLVARSPREGVAGIAELPRLLPSADIVVLAVPLTEETAHLVDDAFLSLMAHDSLLVNVARGAVVDTESLLAHVSAGRIRVALDVTDPEPLPPDHPLWTAQGVLISPHVGGNSTAFLPRARALVLEQLRRWASGEALTSVVSD
jgi:phosphoglycerate dehydrogenase-like enzyme